MAWRWRDAIHRSHAPGPVGLRVGDSGFDPLGLGQDEGRLKWYAEAEKTNGRWAMMVSDACRSVGAVWTS